MKTIKTSHNRRSFLKISTIGAGGLMIGFHWMVGCAPEAEDTVAAIPNEWFDINAFIKIGETGRVTIMSPNPEIGQNIKTSMPMIVAEELEVDWKNVIVEQAGLNTDWYKRQVAGGSQSIRHGWEGLRMAGATAKKMLVDAAAANWEVDASTLSVSDGIITDGNGQSVGYGDIASQAALMEVPEEVEVKDNADFKIIGQSKTNVDIDPILTGKPLFGIDTQVDGMLYATALRPPAFGQTLVSYDDTETRKVNGVVDVIKFGDKIGVLAKNTWAAMKGQKLLKPEWKDGDKQESTAYHNDELTKLLSKTSKEHRRNDGDIDKAFAEADQIVERVYEAPFLPHNCMEPMNFFAHVTAEKAEFTGPIQTPQWTRSRIATLLERDEADVKINMTRMGGGFGRRLYGGFALEAAELSQKSGKPVQLVFTREDDMTEGTYRPASKYRIKASIKNNKISGYQLTEACVRGNMYDAIPNFFPAGCIDNYQVNTHKLESNITTGAWRAPYTNFLGSAEQSFFDELAFIIEVDPIQLRLDLLANGVGNTDEKIEYSPERMIKVIEVARDKSNWGNAANGVFQGFSAYYSHNTHVAEVAEIVIQDDVPMVNKVICVVDCGIVVNPIAAKNQVEGGVVDGIGHAMFGDFSFGNGKPSASNFNQYRLIRMGEHPEVVVHFIDNGLDPTGLGEPSLPPAGGALANAIHAATGKRLYKQPYLKELELLG